MHEFDLSKNIPEIKFNQLNAFYCTAKLPTCKISLLFFCPHQQI